MRDTGEHGTDVKINKKLLFCNHFDKPLIYCNDSEWTLACYKVHHPMYDCSDDVDYYEPQRKITEWIK